jgi:hypothetical protein
MTLHSISVVCSIVQVSHLFFLDHSRWDFLLNYWCCWGKLDAPKATWSKWNRCIPLSICMLFYYYRETNKLAKSHCNCLLDFWEVIQFFLYRSLNTTMYRWPWDADLQIPVSQVLHGVTINPDAFSAVWFLNNIQLEIRISEGLWTELFNEKRK